MTINREHFEAWLFSQPKEKELNYYQGHPESQPGCLLCNYFRDNFVVRLPVGSHVVYDATYLKETALPGWILEMLRPVRSRFTIAEAQAEYLKLFPDTVPAPALPVQLAGGQAV